MEFKEYFRNGYGPRKSSVNLGDIPDSGMFFDIPKIDIEHPTMLHSIILLWV